MKASLLTRLSDQPDALDHLLSGLTEDQIRQLPPTGKWSIVELHEAHHLFTIDSAAGWFTTDE